MAELHVLHVNVNGLRARKTELEVYLRDTSPDVVLVNETKLGDGPVPRLNGYRAAAVRNRDLARGNGGGGGGVAIYTRKELKFADISPDVDDIVAVDLKTAKGSLLIVSYYRPPYATIDFNADALVTLIQGFKHWIIAGDFNAKHEYFGCKTTNNAGEQMFDFVERCEAIVANDPDSVTRHVVSTGCSELLDFFLVPRCMGGQLADCFVGEDVGSDHLPLHLKLRTGGNIEKYPVRMARVLAKCKWGVFTDAIERNLETVADTADWRQADADNRCEEIRQCIASAIDTACPLQTVRANAFMVSKDTLGLIRLKRKMRRHCQKCDDPELRRLYNNLSRQVKEAIQAEKTKSWNDATADLDNLKGGKLWKKFKLLTGEGGSTRSVARVMDEAGVLTSGPEAAADAFAVHLSKVHVTHEGPEFCDNTRRSVETAVNGDGNAKNYTSCFSQMVPENLDEHPLVAVIEPGEVAVALRSCRNASSPGSDGITYGMLKRVPFKMLAALAQLYTVCLLAGYFPRCWKTAIGVMIPKKGKDGKVVSNYRPISLLSTLGKLFEKVLTTRLYRHFEETSFFNQWQRAYLFKKEAAEHIYRLTQSIKLAKSRHWSTSVVSFDVEKAFDSVWHDGLRYKLTGIGLPVKLVRLLSSFLSDRTISVRVGNALSRPVALGAGTPQGSVLSPLLYLVYVNDIPINPTSKCDGGQFADDISMWTLAKTTRVAKVRMQKSLKDLELWCSKWRIKLNVAKTQLVRFPKRRDKLELTLFGRGIVEQDELTLLGVTFDQRLSFNSHCRKKAKEATRRVGLLRRVSGQRWGASRRVLLNLYKQYVRPVLETGSAGTADGAKTSLALLQRVQNSALRTSLRVPRRTRVTKLHRLARMVPITERLSSLQVNAVARFKASPLMESLRIQQMLLLKPNKKVAGLGSSRTDLAE